MNLTNWLKKRRLHNLREQLAMVDARMESDRYIERVYRKVYPSSMARNAADRASLMYRIKELEGDK